MDEIGMDEIGMDDGSVAETRELYARIATRFGDLLDACPADGWSATSPCPGWTARDVAAHVVRNHRRALAGLDGSSFAAPGPDEDVRPAWRSATDGVRRALADPGLAGTALGHEFGSIPFADFIRRMACADTLIHSWDFARATGQDETLDAEGIGVVTDMLMPEDDRIRMPGAFAGKITPSADADPQTRLLNFLGRQA